MINQILGLKNESSADASRYIDVFGRKERYKNMNVQEVNEDVSANAETEYVRWYEMFAELS